MNFKAVVQMPVSEQAKATPAQIVEGNLKLAVFMANQFAAGDYNKVDDLAQEAAIGLHIAALRFDPSKGASFGTYAGYWIKQRIKRFLQDNNTVIRVPNHQYDKNKDKKKRKFTQAALNAIYGVFSISDIKLEDEEGEFEIKDENAVDPSLNLSNAEYNLLITKLMQTALSERERVILTERFNLENKYDKRPTLDDLGARFNLTRERVRQIQNNALKKLRAKLELETNQ